MVVVLGLVLTGSVLSGKGIVGGRDERQSLPMDSVAFAQADCLLGSNTFDGLCHQWVAQRSGYTRVGCARCAKAVGDEALEGGRDGDTDLGAAKSDILLEMSPLQLLERRLDDLLSRLWQGEIKVALDDPAFLDDSRLLRARADVARQDALRLASDRVFAVEATPPAVDVVGSLRMGQAESEDQGLAPEEGVIDADRAGPQGIRGIPTEGIDEGGGNDAELVSGELWWLTTYTCEEGYCGFTANNIQVAEYTLEGYRMAACSEHYAFGTRFLVAGRWLVECQDRGSGVVLPNHLDVYFPTAKEAAAWLAQVGDHAKVEVMR